MEGWCFQIMHLRVQGFLWYSPETSKGEESRETSRHFLNEHTSTTIWFTLGLLIKSGFLGRTLVQKEYLRTNILDFFASQTLIIDWTILGKWTWKFLQLWSLLLNIPGVIEAIQLYYRPSDKCWNKYEDKRGHKRRDVCVWLIYVYEFYYFSN